MKSGISALTCPVCAVQQVHTVALLGDQVFACCHICREVRLLETTDDGSIVTPEHDIEPAPTLH